MSLACKSKHLNDTALAVITFSIKYNIVFVLTTNVLKRILLLFSVTEREQVIKITVKIFSEIFINVLCIYVYYITLILLNSRTPAACAR